jgi:hypothetical protein
VALARGSAEGLYNAVSEGSFDRQGLGSPTGTEWATIINNPTQTIAATNWQALTFGTWVNAYGGSGQVGHNIVGLEAVVHLISDNIYLDLRITDWGMGFSAGGSFSLMRGAPPPPTTGDYNGNGVVDAADYTVWRDTLGQSVTPGNGADGNANGMIDNGDYDFWKSHFGDVLAGAGSSADQSATVPEPGTILQVAFGALMLTVRSMCRRRCEADRARAEAG